MADLVEETVQGIRARLHELAPVVAEYERLQAAYAALEGSGAIRVTGGRRGPAPGSGGTRASVDGAAARRRGRRVRARPVVRTRRRCLA